MTPQLGLAVAITVALGGITVTAFAYLLSERVLRAATARAMMAPAAEEARASPASPRAP